MCPSGTTGERIIFVGDSAGGNLVLTTAMKLKSLGLRLPHHIFSYYPATIVRSCATPSRFLSVIDPLLPCGIMISCLQVQSPVEYMYTSTFNTFLYEIVQFDWYRATVTENYMSQNLMSVKTTNNYVCKLTLYIRVIIIIDT